MEQNDTAGECALSPLSSPQLPPLPLFLSVTSSFLLKLSPHSTQVCHNCNNLQVSRSLEQVPSVWSGADAAAVAAARAATVQSATSTQYLRPELASRPNLPPDDDAQLCISQKHKLWTSPELQQVPKDEAPALPASKPKKLPLPTMGWLLHESGQLPGASDAQHSRQVPALRGAEDAKAGVAPPAPAPISTPVTANAQN
jgi:hypothetical protein